MGLNLLMTDAEQIVRFLCLISFGIEYLTYDLNFFCRELSFIAIWLIFLTPLRSNFLNIQLV